MSKTVVTERMFMNSAFILRLCAELQIRMESAFAGLDDLTLAEQFAIEVLSTVDASRLPPGSQKLVYWIQDQLNDNRTKVAEPHRIYFACHTCEYTGEHSNVLANCPKCGISAL